MAESAQYINSLIETSPSGDDYKYDGAAHMRVVKSATKNTFPNVNGAMTTTAAELNAISGVAANVQTQLSALLSSNSLVSTALIRAENSASAAAVSLSALSTVYAQCRDVMPKHFASVILTSSQSFALVLYEAIAIDTTSHLESTLSIIESVTTGAEALPTSTYWPINPGSGAGNKYTRFKTPPSCTRARLTFNVSTLFGAGSGDGTTTSGVSIFDTIASGVYNTDNSTEVIIESTDKVGYIRTLQNLVETYSESAGIIYKNFIQYNSQNYHNNQYETRELTVSPGSYLIPYLAPNGDAVIQHRFLNNPANRNECYWIEVEYR